jgi:hypothetical protein
MYLRTSGRLCPQKYWVCKSQIHKVPHLLKDFSSPQICGFAILVRILGAQCGRLSHEPVNVCMRSKSKINQSPKM